MVVGCKMVYNNNKNNNNTPCRKSIVHKNSFFNHYSSSVGTSPSPKKRSKFHITKKFNYPIKKVIQQQN
ncbi:hypothetical protein BLOT_013069 [Blomia tropicalis]|nr:hypothetical protein BLOT_013069 [Blomia tropicalis]